MDNDRFIVEIKKIEAKHDVIFGLGQAIDEVFSKPNARQYPLHNMIRDIMKKHWRWRVKARGDTCEKAMAMRERRELIHNKHREA